MSTLTRLRRGVAIGASTAVAAGLLAFSSTTTAQAAEQPVDDATLTWGLNGYAQVGVFGPWTYKDLEGNVEQLTGSVSGGSQDEYIVEPFPATSFPATQAGKTANAIKFTAGEGTIDAETGAVDLAWDGEYTVNAYPAMYGAPDEIYADPELDLDADGNGTLTVDFTLGAGVDIDGNPVDAENFGRITLLTFSEGSVEGLDADGFRANPDYAGVSNGIEGQSTTCTAPDVWGSWPTPFIDAISETAVLAHFYSTGCGGMQNSKPALPLDIGFGDTEPAPAPNVAVSDTELWSGATNTVTVEGSGFTTTGNLGTRSPLPGQPAGVYVVFGDFDDTWRFSESAPSSSRRVISQKWALPEPSYTQQNPNGSNGLYVPIEADGSFEVELEVAKPGSVTGNLGIYTYPGSGAANADEELYEPIEFYDDFRVPTTPSFTDVGTDHQFFRQIEWLAATRIGRGFDNGTYRPGNPVNRGSMSAFLYRLAGEPEFTPPATPSFSDVPSTHQFYRQIEWLAAEDIGRGFPNGTFRPGNAVNRGSMSAFLYRFVGEPTYTPSGQAFTDVASTHQFYRQIEWLASVNVGRGYANGTYRPGNAVNRGSMSAFLLRIDELELD